MWGVASAVICASLVLAPHGEHAARAATTVDFNGDGFEDYAISAPAGTVGHTLKAGYIAILYGAASGVDPARRRILHLDSANVPNDPVAADAFGARTAAGDFNADGYTDLAVGSYNPFDLDRRFVTLLWGGKDGLALGTPLIDPPRAGVPPDLVDRAEGRELAAGDFDGDGSDDLAATGERGTVNIFHGPFQRDGRPARKVTLGGSYEQPTRLVAGDLTGDGKDDLVTTHAWEETAEPSLFWKGGPQGLAGRPERLDAATTATVGDIDGDHYGDLVMRVIPGGFVDTLKSDKGTIKVLYGSADGPGRRTRTLTQDSPGVPGTGERGDQLGFDLAAGDVNGDGYADLAAGLPGKAGGGAVLLFSGGRDGPAGARLFTQASPGVPGTAEDGDRFGASVSLRDLNGDGKADLGVGAPGESGTAAGTGAAWVLPGSTGGLTTDGARSFDPAALQASDTGSHLGMWSAK
ncbi:FG-GAP-like repeat-containing protein [Nonomuraea sp. NEAU-A123]|uniref:FG-GAP-like repeat-containing protein n=1 Tax=Nonomuraea sp. NEAU-A123 TaxID=2839649 RepID=UPI001BE3DF2A|nr:FG-GAP-like repeat-containing protein [Nonomuraea sp. NEAU-A123]MBT2232076.1 integrin alpha [Nonomuraea sp. NEAU-A123]